ncbi:MAG TPA: trypsin-like peptidase domain-containing protein [Gemmataceae bacterium]|nr:trypsin-like peptidase domain-containing protein [Gemmataceae bacterium]
MRRMASLTPLVVLLFLAEPARSEERNRFADVLALQEAVHESIERAEPSIACILVSRSEKYRAHTPAQPKAPGRLGRFDLDRALLTVGRDSPEGGSLRRLDLSNPNNVPESYGSGIVLDTKQGLILTLAHVVRNATKIYVRLPGGHGSWADIHAADPRSDLAVLQLINHLPNLKGLKLGDGGKLRKGDFILSLSNPFAAGLRDGSPSASWGIVSNLRRRATAVRSDFPSQRNAKLPLYCFNTLIQTDTRMNLGCSGGALLNLQGELVGLTSSLAGTAGGETPGGFAVPLDAGMRRIIRVLLRGEEVEYGILGVYLMKSDDVPEGHVHITSLMNGGPAAKGGIRGPIFPGSSVGGGDFIHSIDDTPVHSNDDLFLAVSLQLAGSTIKVEVSESPNGPRRICSVTLAKFGSHDLQPIASRRSPARGGLRVDWTSTIFDSNRGIEEGVVIREVLPGSAADKARLQPGMIIKSVDRQKVTNPAEFYRAVEKANGPVELTFTKLPQGGEERVTINVK